jgi:adenylylsulfate kinase
MSQSPSSNITWHEGAVSAADRRRVVGQRGAALWMTGLSGSGKSTIACIAEQMLLAEGHNAYRLDGDNLRHGLCSDLGFTPEDRAENIRRAGAVAKLLAQAGVIVLASFISPYLRDRQAVRDSFGSGEFIEVYVKASLAAAESRDPKGLYKKARAGVIRQFTGIDDPYEPPVNAEIVLDTEIATAEQSAAKIVEYLRAGGYLSAA